MEDQSAVLIDLTKVEIDLSNGELQREGGSRLLHLIESQVVEAARVCYDKIKPTDITYSRPHRAILVEGGRGSGKTTFLLSHLERLSTPGKQDGTNAQDFERIAAMVHVLPMVDPTLIEAKDNMIIVILQVIEAAIDTIGGRGRHDDDEMAKLDKAREELAEGLSMLDGIGQKEPYGNQWEDPYWVMSEGLRKAKKGRNFERKFNLYLQQALEILGKKAFVLAFDDVDTNFGHGHVILETIRKYLTSPQLILILSGDLDLYGRLIRGHIYKTFGENILKYDAGVTKVSGQDVQTAVRELEEQYLLKILPPQNRIRMLPLGGLTHARNIQVLSDRTGTTTAEKALPDWISTRVRKILGERRMAEHPFVQVIWREHLRLVLGYLRALDLAFEMGGKPGEISSAADLRASRSAVLKVFETRLRMDEVPTDLLDTENFDWALKSTFNWLSKQEEPDTLARFGIPGDTNKAIVLHCLALAIAQGLDKSGNGLKALLCLALPAIMLKRTHLASSDRKKQVIDFLWNQGSPFLPEVAARISAVDRYLPIQIVAKPQASSFGSVGLAGERSGSLKKAVALHRVYYDRARPKSGDVSFEELENASKNRSSAKWLELTRDARKDLQPRFGVAWFSIEDIVNEHRCGDYGKLLNLIFFRRFDMNNNTFRSISALSLLATITELLANGDCNELEALAVGAIIPAFGEIEVQEEGKNATWTKNAPEANALEGKEEEDGDGALSDDDIEAIAVGNGQDEQTTYGVFIDSLRSWQTFAKALASQAMLSPSLLGTLATRLHDDLLDLDDKVPPAWGSGDILHRQITNILNAVVVVTSETSGVKESPKTSDLPLGNALRRENRAEEKPPARGSARSRTIPTSGGGELHALAVILMSCPLVWLFLNPEERYDYLNDKEVKLQSDVMTVLDAWVDKRGSEVEPKVNKENFKIWTTPPEIPVKISRISDKGKQRQVTVNGFFDLLNVVPRYADDAK